MDGYIQGCVHLDAAIPPLPLHTSVDYGIPGPTCWWGQATGASRRRWGGVSCVLSPVYPLYLPGFLREYNILLDFRGSFPRVRRAGGGGGYRTGSYPVTPWYPIYTYTGIPPRIAPPTGPLTPGTLPGRPPGAVTPYPPVYTYTTSWYSYYQSPCYSVPYSGLYSG